MAIEIELLSDIKENKIQHLDLKCKGLTNHDVMSLVGVLESNNSVKSINLEGNEIDAEGIKYLANILKSKNCSIIDLNLRKNKIGPEGAKYLAEAFKDKNCPVSLVNLAENSIGPEGAKYLAEAFMDENCPVTSIDLAHNSISSEARNYLTSAVKEKISVTYLGENFKKHPYLKRNNSIADKVKHGQYGQFTSDEEQAIMQSPENALYIIKLAISIETKQQQEAGVTNSSKEIENKIIEDLLATDFGRLLFEKAQEVKKDKSETENLDKELVIRLSETIAAQTVPGESSNATNPLWTSAMAAVSTRGEEGPFVRNPLLVAGGLAAVPASIAKRARIAGSDDKLSWVNRVYEESAHDRRSELSGSGDGLSAATAMGF